MKKFLLPLAAVYLSACACVPVVNDSPNYAVVCDDEKEPDCAPDKKVIVK